MKTPTLCHGYMNSYHKIYILSISLFGRMSKTVGLLVYNRKKKKRVMCMKNFHNSINIIQISQRFIL